MTQLGPQRAIGLLAKSTLWVTVLCCIAIIVWRLGSSKFLGDEYNALYLMQPTLWDYITHSHYGHLLKIQFWLIHQWAQGEFIWYRIPAAFFAVLTILWMSFHNLSGLSAGSISRSLVCLWLAGNSYFLYFARWGMPSLSEGIFLSTVVLTLALREATSPKDLRWTPGCIFLFLLLPWVYPATLVLFGGISLFFLLRDVIFSRPLYFSSALHSLWRSLVPLSCGIVSFLLLRISTPESHWARRRSHHSGFNDYAQDTGRGAFQFILDMLHGIWENLSTLPFAVTQHFPEASYTYQSIFYLMVASILYAPLHIVLSRAQPVKFTKRFLKAYFLFFVIFTSTLFVTIFAAFFDLFPAGNLRYVFFLLPVIALMAAISLGYIVQSVNAVSAITSIGVTGLAVVFVLGAGVLQLYSILTTRNVQAERDAAMYAELTSSKNQVVLSVRPGFFLPDLLLPHGVGLFRVFSPDAVSSKVYFQISNLNHSENSRLVIFGKMNEIFNSSGFNSLAQSLSQITANLGYVLDSRLDAPPLTLLIFTMETFAPMNRTAVGQIELEQAHEIKSIRIEPTEISGGKVSVDKLALITNRDSFPVHVCNDRKLQLVRSIRLQENDHGGCVFRFGNESGTGWIAPSMLRSSKRLADADGILMELSGELGAEARVYINYGQGYSSTNLFRIPVRATETALSRHTNGSKSSNDGKHD